MIPKKTLLMLKDARVARQVQEAKMRENEMKATERMMIRDNIMRN